MSNLDKLTQAKERFLLTKTPLIKITSEYGNIFNTSNLEILLHKMANDYKYDLYYATDNKKDKKVITNKVEKILHDNLIDCIDDNKFYVIDLNSDNNILMEQYLLRNKNENRKDYFNKFKRVKMDFSVNGIKNYFLDIVNYNKKAGKPNKVEINYDSNGNISNFYYNDDTALYDLKKNIFDNLFKIPTQEKIEKEDVPKLKAHLKQVYENADFFNYINDINMKQIIKDYVYIFDMPKSSDNPFDIVTKKGIMLFLNKHEKNIRFALKELNFGVNFDKVIDECIENYNIFLDNKDKIKNYEHIINLISNKSTKDKNTFYINNKEDTTNLKGVIADNITTKTNFYFRDNSSLDNQILALKNGVNLYEEYIVKPNLLNARNLVGNTIRFTNQDIDFDKMFHKSNVFTINILLQSYLEKHLNLEFKPKIDNYDNKEITFLKLGDTVKDHHDFYERLSNSKYKDIKDTLMSVYPFKSSIKDIIDYQNNNDKTFLFTGGYAYGVLSKVFTHDMPNILNKPIVMSGLDKVYSKINTPINPDEFELCYGSLINKYDINGTTYVSYMIDDKFEFYQVKVGKLLPPFENVEFLLKDLSDTFAKKVGDVIISKITSEYYDFDPIKFINDNFSEYYPNDTELTNKIKESIPKLIDLTVENYINKNDTLGDYKKELKEPLKKYLKETYEFNGLVNYINTKTNEKMIILKEALNELSLISHNASRTNDLTEIINKNKNKKENNEFNLYVNSFNKVLLKAKDNFVKEF